MIGKHFGIGVLDRRFFVRCFDTTSFLFEHVFYKYLASVFFFSFFMVRGFGEREREREREVVELVVVCCMYCMVRRKQRITAKSQLV